MKHMRKNTGITLIALVITIVVLLVLAVVGIGVVTNTGIITKAQKTKFLNDVGKYKEELELYKKDWEIAYQLNNGQPIVIGTKQIGSKEDIDAQGYEEINLFIKSFDNKYENRLFIKDGDLVYRDSGNSKEVEWVKDLGLEIQSEVVTIKIGKQGLGKISSSVEIKDGKIEAKVGQEITLTAITGSAGEGEGKVESRFDGWYSNGTKVNETSSYTFKVIGDQTLIAKFKTDATLIYYSENNEEKIKIDSSNPISGYRNDNTITKVYIKDGVTIARQSFNGCANLTDVTIGDNVTFEVGLGYLQSIATFGNCTKLKTVNMGKNISLNGSDNYKKSATFYGSNALETVTIESISAVGVYALTEVGPALKGDIVINEGVTTIGSNAFAGCTGIKNVTIPSTVTSIGGSAFASCTGITNITVKMSRAEFESVSKDSTWNSGISVEITYE